MGARASLNPAHLPVVPGGEAHTEIAVTNNGQVVDAFTLQVLGDAVGWAICDPPSISLLPGQAGTAHIVFRPQPGPGLPHGPVPFAVRVASTEDPPGSVVEEGLLEVGGLSQVTTDLSPRTGRARGMGASKHRIAVDNYGNTPALVTLVGSDDADTVQVAIQPSELDVAPGTATMAKVRVRARRRFWRGPSVTHRFHVTAVPPAGEPIRSDGTLLQEAVLPAWLPKALALVAAAAIALAALWFGLLRPVVKNTATTAGTAAAQQAVQQALASSSPSAGGGGSGSSTPTPTPTSSSSSGSSSGKPHSKAAPFAQALSTTNSTTSSIVAPPGHSLAITDVVFENPAGDQGVLTVSRSGQVLFSEELANFRDYDLHFITPIMVPPGQALTMAVNCTNPGSKKCTPSVFVSGTSRAG